MILQPNKRMSSRAQTFPETRRRVEAMTTTFSKSLLAIGTTLLFGALVVFAQTAPQHDMSKMDMDMTAMMNGPHHVLAMTYMQTIGTFAKALNAQAEATTPIDASFAREAVAEMKRSLGHMEEHHAEHMEGMKEDMRKHMESMMKDMDNHRSMLKEAVSTLEKDVLVEPPSSSQIAKDSATVIQRLDAMAKMSMQQ